MNEEASMWFGYGIELPVGEIAVEDLLSVCVACKDCGEMVTLHGPFELGVPFFARCDYCGESRVYKVVPLEGS